MNITISKRAKSYNNLLGNNSPLIINQQSMSKRSLSSLNRQKNLNAVQRQQQQSHCCRWLFGKCLKKPSNLQQLAKEQPINLKKTAAIHKITCRQAKKNLLHIDRQQKINLVCTNRNKIKAQDLQIRIVSSQWLSRQAQSKQKQLNAVHISQKTNAHLDTKPNGAYASYTTSNQTSKQKIMTNLYSLKPSTYISNNNSSVRERTPNKNKLTLSNHFVTIMQTDIKPFTYHQANYPQQQTSSYQNKVYDKPIIEEVVSQSLSRFQIVNPSEHNFVGADLQNNSVNTSCIRKKIQFSSEFSDKNKYQNCIYEPIYMLSQDVPQTNHKNHKSCYSQLVKTVNVDDQNYFNSAKSNQQESVVLQKGLDQIFNDSPTFKKLSQQRLKQIEIQQVINSEEDEYLRNIFNNYDDQDQVLQISN